MTRTEENPELFYKDESYAIVGACFAVYKEKGCGFLEPVYHECLEIELELQGIPFQSKAPRTCNIAGVLSFKRSPRTSFAMTRSSSKSKPSPPWSMSTAHNS